MQLETANLIIRSVMRGDEKIFSEMAKEGGLEDVGFEADCETWIDSWIEEAILLDRADDPQIEYIAHTICLKETGEIIGSVGCSWYQDLKEVGITYFIGREFRRKGYAAESIQAYKAFFFAHYPIGKLIATIREANEPSWRTIDKCGFILAEKKIYQDINDDEPKLYRFYTAYAE